MTTVPVALSTQPSLPLHSSPSAKLIVLLVLFLSSKPKQTGSQTAISRNSMEIESTETSNWLFDYSFTEDISAVPGEEFKVAASVSACFIWPSQDVSMEIDCSFGDSEVLKETPLKRLKSESCCASGSKAGRERLRRNKLNERFLELGSVLEPGRPPKKDKAAILNDCVRTVTQLRSEAKKLKEANEDLEDKIKELKAEKNELRDEKQRLKADKEKLAEQQFKTMGAQPGFLPHPSSVPAAFGAQGQAAGNKSMPFITYPGIAAMWQFMPPAVRDTSQDHVLRPPVA